MKITRQDLEASHDESPLELFRQGIRAEETAAKYTSTLRRILCGILEDVLEGTFEHPILHIINEYDMAVSVGQNHASTALHDIMDFKPYWMPNILWQSMHW